MKRINHDELSFVDAVKEIRYMDRRGFGFIHGYRNIRIFFHISVLKRAHFPNFEQLLELLENEKYSTFPIIWFVTDENEKGLYVKEFLHKDKFDSTYRNDFISEFGNSLKNEVINGKDIDSRTELLLLELWGKEGYSKIIHSRYEISEFIKSKILELKNEKRPTPIFFKLGKKVSGRLVVTDVQRYDPLSMPANSDGEEVKSFIEDRLTKPPVLATIDFCFVCYDVLFAQSEKDAIQRKKEQLFKEYLAEQERARIAREQAEERARIAREQAEEQDRIVREELELEEAEYKALLEEVRPLGFTKSSQVSRYIRENNLKQKYGSISGYLAMNRCFDTWVFEGGINPKYYKRLCIDLGLENNNSGSSVAGFSPYRKK